MNSVNPSRVFLALACVALIATAVALPSLLQPWWRAQSIAKGLISGTTGHFDGSGITDDDMVAIAECRLTTLFLADNPELTDKGLLLLRKDRPIESLSLRRTEVTDKGIEWIAQCGTLTSVNLQLCDVTDASLRSLCANPGLRAIDVSQTRCSLDVPCIADLEHLEEVWAVQVPLTAGGIQVLGSCRSLRTLVLTDCRITCEMLCSLEGHPKLEYLDVSGAELCSRDIECVSRIAGLSALILDRCVLTEGDLTALCALPNLYMLSLKNVVEADSKTAELRRRMPDVKVILK